MDPHQAALIEAAGPLGIECTDLSEAFGEDVVAYQYRGRREFVHRGRVYESMSAVGERLCQNKAATLALLTELGFPTPRSRIFHDAEAEREELERFLSGGEIFVAKPLSGKHGMGVGMDLRTIDGVLAHWNRYRHLDGVFMIEEQVFGQDLRVQAVGGRLVAACCREPAGIVGDGVSTVGKLADARDRFVRTQNPQNRLELDDISHELLREQGFDLESVPAENIEVKLKKVANLGQGGSVIDITEEIHPAYAEWIGTIAKHLRISTFSLDLIAEAPDKDPQTASKVLELNGSAQWLHHTFSEVRTHDIATLVLRDLFSL